MKKRGNTSGAPRRYSAWEWFKGYAAWVITLPIYIALWAFARVFKRIPNWLHRKLLLDHSNTMHGRKHDVRIPTDLGTSPYMLRWWKIKRNAFFNIYYHDVRRSDDDTAHHDHPWWSFSIVLEGGYTEERILAGGVYEQKFYPPGSVLFRGSGKHAHRLILQTKMGLNRQYQDVQIRPGEFTRLDHIPAPTPYEVPARTIFITGPVLRRWGFHARAQWVDAYHWDDYLDEFNIKSDRMRGYAEQNNKGN